MDNKLEMYFENGLSIKGSYQLVLNGCFINLYLVNNKGQVLATKTLTHREPTNDAQALLRDYISHVYITVQTYKVGELTNPDALVKACPLIFLKAFPKAY